MDEQRWRQRAGSAGQAAEVYERSRPGYPADAVRWLLPVGARRVLDLGAGTGKLTRQLLAEGLDVVAVEPSEQLRALVPAPAQALAGSAEDLPLPDASCDAVIVGQAFHWFDAAAALPEIARVLRPGGVLGLLWNDRDETVAWVREVWALFGGEPERSVTDVPFRAVAGLATPERRSFSLEQPMTRELLADLVASRSAVIVLPDDDRARVLERVRALAPADAFVLPYRTEAWRSVRR